MKNLELDLAFAQKIALEAGNLLLTYYQKSMNTKLAKVTKNVVGLVTDADLASNDFLIQAIKREYPHQSILSEESKKDRKRGNYEWVIDPLDGTNNFYRGDPTFSVSIALRHKGESKLGVVYAPVFDELYYAAEGIGAHVKSKGSARKLQISDRNSLKMFNFSFGTGIDFEEADKCDRLVKVIRDSHYMDQFRRRMVESCAYSLCKVADGVLDAHFDITKTWDIAAGEIIVKEAGGKFTYFKKGDFNVLLASNGIIHNKLVNIIKKSL